ncbi:MAG: Ig-like domain-containing protein [Dermatophilaceae bacterium]|nr:Ig-like domain-containing protein [Dermatophilaceae bacterium]
MAPHTIISFPERDFVSAEGYAEGDAVTVEVIRSGFTVGVSHVLPADDLGTLGFDGFVEVNHPGGGCWEGVTPDIRPGDVVRLTTASGEVDQTTTAGVTVTQPATALDATTVQLKGTAVAPGGGQLPVDQLESRVITPGLKLVVNGRRDVRADAADGNFAYDGPGLTTWTATMGNLGGKDPVSGVTDMTKVLQGESRGMWLGSNPLAGTEATIYEFGLPGGPEAPCNAPADRGPSTPDMTAASDTGSSNADNITRNTTPTFGGVRGLATATTINVYVDGALAGTTAPAANGTWSFTPGAPLANGVHTITAGEVTPGSPETMAAGSLSFTIDTVAPTTTITSRPAVAGSVRTVAFGFSSEPGSTFTCSLTPGSAAAACVTGKSYGPLADGRYTFTVGARDRAGNVGANTTAAFAVGVAPTVSARSPLPGQTRIAQTADVTATLSRAVTGVSGTSFVLRTPSGATVPAVVSYNATTRVATLNPNAALAADTRSPASITNAIKSSDFGVPVVTTSWTFVTGPAPVVNFRSPASGAVGVARTSNVVVGFNEAVTGASTASAILRSPSGATVPAVVSYNATTRRVTLNPNATLAAGTRYTFSLTSGIRDLAGNILTPSTVAFTTGS